MGLKQVEKIHSSSVSSSIQQCMTGHATCNCENIKNSKREINPLS